MGNAALQSHAQRMRSYIDQNNNVTIYNAIMKGWYIHINKMMHLANKKSIKLERVMFFAMETKILHVLGKLFGKGVKIE